MNPTTLDWICILILMFLGAWKLNDIAIPLADKTAKWIIKKVEGRK